MLDAVFSLSHTYVLGVIKNVGRKKSRKFIGPELIREKEREKELSCLKICMPCLCEGEARPEVVTAAVMMPAF